MSTAYVLVPLQLVPPFSARASFPATFAGFDGHFPGRPILPGFIHIQIAVDLLQHVHPGTSLAGVDQAKFTRPIAPDEEIHLTLVPTATPLEYDAELTVAGQPCSRFRVHLRQDAPHPPR